MSTVDEQLAAIRAELAEIRRIVDSIHFSATLLDIATDRARYEERTAILGGSGSRRPRRPRTSERPGHLTPVDGA